MIQALLPVLVLAVIACVAGWQWWRMSRRHGRFLAIAAMATLVVGAWRGFALGCWFVAHLPPGGASWPGYWELVVVHEWLIELGYVLLVNAIATSMAWPIVGWMYSVALRLLTQSKAALSG